jgi:hypothetical protein
MCGVPLLSRGRPICFQNRFDEGLRWFQTRLRSNSNLSFSRNCVSQCFAHHAPMNPQLLRHSLDRSRTVCMLTPDLFK